MEQMNVHAAKTHFSKILARVEAGESVVIARGGRPVAKLVPWGGRRRPRRAFGTAKGKLRLAAGWNEPLPPAVLRAFE